MIRGKATSWFAFYSSAFLAMLSRKIMELTFSIIWVVEARTKQKELFCSSEFLPPPAGRL
jgi:hypothetical protein